MLPDPELKPILSAMEHLPPLWDIPLELMRRPSPEFEALLGITKEDVGSVEDTFAPGSDSNRIHLRVYLPRESRDEYATVVFYHGGGFVIGSVESYDNLCRMIANASGCRVVSVEYRLAPEHKFPAGVNDAFDALKWVCASIPSKAVAVMGDSAGGNLAAVAAQLASRNGPAIRYQVLIYPVLMQAGTSPSAVENSGAAGLSLAEMRWFGSRYFDKPADRVNPLASPLMYEKLDGLPPAMIITAEMDPLRDQGEMYASRLRTAGVPVVGVRYSGMIHGFLSYRATTAGKSALASIAAALRSALYGE